MKKIFIIICLFISFISQAQYDSLEFVNFRIMPSVALIGGEILSGAEIDIRLIKQEPALDIYLSYFIKRNYTFQDGVNDIAWFGPQMKFLFNQKGRYNYGFNLMSSNLGYGSSALIGVRLSKTLFIETQYGLFLQSDPQFFFSLGLVFDLNNPNFGKLEN